MAARKNNILLPLLVLIFVTTFATLSAARDVTFTWTANTEEVDGYKLYYKTGSPGQPYDGTGVTEGASPISTGDVTTYTLHGLADTETYYFVLTAYVGAMESDYSSELTLSALPAGPGEITAHFSWLPNEESNLAGYKIHYGTLSGNYDNVIDIGNPSPVDGRIRGDVPGLTEGTTYYFAATAYDAEGNESDYSVEVVWTAAQGGGSAAPPVAANSSFTTNEDQPLSGTVTASNDSGLPISYQVQQNVAHGTLLLETGSGSFTYTPDTNMNGTDSFTFTATDDNGTSNTATINITIAAINDPPVADAVSLQIDEDTVLNGQLHAGDIDGDSLSYSLVANGTKGTAVISGSGGLTYTPNANATGTDSFTFQVNDGHGGTDTATVDITITAINDLPVAMNGTLTAVNGQTTTGSLQANDVDNDELTFSIVSDPLHAVSITNTATGTYSFTAVEAMEDPYTFTFKVNDGTGDSNTATVNVTIQDGSIITKIFGDTPDSNYPGTLADTFTNINDNINDGSEHLSTWSWSSPAPHKIANTIIIKADLTDIPSSATIIEARLYLYQTDSNGASVYNNSVHKIIGREPIINQVSGYNAYNGNPWTPVPAGTTHNDAPLGLADIEPAESTIQLDTLQQYHSWPVTDMVREWVNNPSNNYGLLIQGEPENVETGRTFAASENLNGAIRPKLVISYTILPPVPQILSIEVTQ